VQPENVHGAIVNGVSFTLLNLEARGRSVCV
jgi:hypothetical protein